MNRIDKINFLLITEIILAFVIQSCQAQTDCSKCYDGNPEYKKKIEWARKDERKKLQLEIDSLKRVIADKEAELEHTWMANINNVTAADSTGIPDFDAVANLKSLLKTTQSFAWQMTFQGKTYDAYVVDTRTNRLELFNAKGENQVHTFRSIHDQIKKQHSRLAFAMNAGMYNPDRSPQGLFISNGKRTQKWDMLPKGKRSGNFYAFPHTPGFQYGHGIFYVKKNSYQTSILASDQKEKIKEADLLLATQSGPIMVYNGQINQFFRKGSKNTNIRNGVGILSDHKVVFIISKELVNFYEFSELFLTVFGCKEALYLDGVISRHYLPELGISNINVGNSLGPIITVIK